MRDGLALPSAFPLGGSAPAAHLEPIRLPRDELAHEFPVEWWYFAGHVGEIHGTERLSFMVTAIRGTKWVVPPLTVSFVKRIDHARGPLQLLQSGGAFAVAYEGHDTPVSYRLGYAANIYNLWVASPDRWRIDGQPGHYRLRLWNAASQPELDLELTATAPAVLLSEDGIVDYGAGHRLAYYVRPKIRVTGYARFGGRLRVVTGPGWYERQWGSAPTTVYAWKYLNVSLDDGEQWIFFHTKLATVERHYAARMPAAGGIEELPLRPADFRNVDVVGRPLGTDLRVDMPDGPMQLSVRPLYGAEPDIESIYPFVPGFWESACLVEGQRNGTPVRGWSMTELRGYG
ncbi:MAG TPA: lipocalin-like domain-containing protein [Candidatus Eisenbacteria bacterium]|nr:lipocalin-like domain-containing protein [Candidatus Eisenbacteria bacterium]